MQGVYSITESRQNAVGLTKFNVGFGLTQNTAYITASVYIRLIQTGIDVAFRAADNATDIVAKMLIAYSAAGD